jgi:hypothetical protein
VEVDCSTSRMLSLFSAAWATQHDCDHIFVIFLWRILVFIR